MDLWNIKDYKQKARKLIEDRGYNVKKVHDLLTGLWCDVELMDGSYIKVLDYQITKR